jgi:hypothetical protein
MGDDPPQPRWVQPPGGFQQHRLGLHRDMGGEILGAVGEHLGVGRGDGPLGQGLGGGGQRPAEQGPGGPHTAGGGAGTHAQPGPQPPSGGAGLDALLRAGGAGGIHRGQPGEAVAVHAIRQPPEPQHPLGQGDVGQPVQALGGQPVDLGLQRRQPGRCSGRVAGRMGVRVHGSNLSAPHSKASTKPEMGTTSPTEPGRRRVPAGSRPTPVPGNCMGPDRPTPCPRVHMGPTPAPTAPAPRTDPDPPTPALQVPQPGYPTRS